MVRLASPQLVPIATATTVFIALRSVCLIMFFGSYSECPVAEDKPRSFAPFSTVCGEGRGGGGGKGEWRGKGITTEQREGEACEGPGISEKRGDARLRSTVSHTIY